MDVHESVQIGSDFLGYRIEELIGRGGMGVVYRAQDLRLKRPVALKFVAPSLARDARFRERFARESELVMSLEHPNVVPIYDAGDVDGRVYLAMRLVDGNDLGSLIRAEGALEAARAIAIGTQIAAALDAAHARGLVHRDVKPSNVLLDGSEHVYLADFGLTRRLDDQTAELSDDRSVGTPAYLAPEQLEGRPLDGRADGYALGCLLYECLTGEPVFPRDSRLAVAWAHLEDEPPRPSRRNTALPEAIDAVIAKALAKDPEGRFASCAALVGAAGRALGLGTTRASHRRRTLLIAGAVALGVAAAAAAIATTLARVGGPLFAGPNTLARIDPATNRVVKVIRVGNDPVVSAGTDFTVWTYNRGDGTITQVNGVTNRVVATTRVARPAECCSLFSGPVLGADVADLSVSGAWFVEGGTAGSKPRLAHLLVDSARAVQYPLPITPVGVAVGGAAVWVVGHDSRHDEVLRIAPATGRVTATIRRPRSAGIDSIAFGYGWVWGVSSAKATLYRIAPHPLRWDGSRVIADSRATQPEIMFRGPDIWVRTADGMTNEIHPSSLQIYDREYNGPPGWEENQGQLGSLWWYDWPTGLVHRQEVADGPKKRIQVTRARPSRGGPCLTSMAVASASLWVTVAPSSNGACRR